MALGELWWSLGISAVPWGYLLAPGELCCPPGSFTLPQSLPGYKPHIFLLSLPLRQHWHLAGEVQPTPAPTQDQCQPCPVLVLVLSLGDSSLPELSP